MARVIVQSDKGRVLMSEHVREVNIDTEHSAAQLLERMEWAIREAERRLRRPPERTVDRTRRYTDVGA